MKNIATDTFSFAELRENDIMYVDKTAYIWNIINSGKKSFFLSRPRRFGKSLLISTLECFFKGRRDLFKGLDIDRLAPEDVWEEWPVIRLDMSVACTFQDTTVDDHMLRYMLKQRAQDNGLALECEKPDAMLEELIHKLKEKTGKNVVVLVDEYDNPLLSAMDKPVVDNMLQYMANFYKVLKAANDKLRFVFLTGVSKFSHTSLFSGFNNPVDITSNENYAIMLGYTQDELESYFTEHIDEAVRRTGLSRERLLHTLKVRYNGFRFHYRTQTVYNPVSIGLFFFMYEFRNYWWETGTPRFLVDKMRRNPFYLDEMTREWVEFNSYNKSEIKTINSFDLAIQTGYLTIVESSDDTGVPMVRYDFPNKEIQDSWNTYMLGIAAKSEDAMNVSIELAKLRRLLNDADVEGFMERLEWFFSGMPYENVKAAEGNFRNHLRTIFVLFGLPNQCEVQVARGRIDIVAQTQKCAFVFEIKVADTKKDVPAKIEEALRQAAEKNYADKYKAESEQVKVIALVFNRKTRKIAGWKELT